MQDDFKFNQPPPQAKSQKDDFAFGDISYKPLGDNPALIIEQEAKKFGLQVTSRSRSPEHNRVIGGARNSYHLYDQARDIAGDKGKMREFYDYMRTTYGSNLAELIHGTSDHLDHVHVAWNSDRARAKPGVVKNIDRSPSGLMVEREIGAEPKLTPATGGDDFAFAPTGQATTSRKGKAVRLKPAPEISQQPALRRDSSGNPLTWDGYPALKNPDGSITTEESITVTDPRINNGHPTNIPSVWQGKQRSQNEAINLAAATKQQFPFFGSIDAAVRAAKARSVRKGQEADALQHEPSIFDSANISPQATLERGLETVNKPPKIRSASKLGASLRSQLEVAEPPLERIAMKGLDIATRPFQYLSTLAAGAEKKIGSAISTTFSSDPKVKAIADQYGWMNVLDAAAERFYTGHVRPGFEQPVEELYKLAVEHFGGNPESALHSVIASTLGAGTDPVTWLAPGEMMRSRGVETPRVRAYPKSEFPLQAGEGVKAPTTDAIAEPVPKPRVRLVRPAAPVRATEPAPNRVESPVTGERGESLPEQPPKVETPQARQAESAAGVSSSSVGERSYPKTLEEAGLPGGSERTYTVEHKAESIARGRELIAQKGVDGTIEHITGSDVLTPDRVVAADILIDDLHAQAGKLEATNPLEAAKLRAKADALAEDVSVKFTQYGQTVNAAKYVEDSVRGATNAGQKIIDRVKPGQKLSPEKKAEITGHVGKIKAAKAELRELEQRIADMTKEAEVTGTKIAPETKPARVRPKVKTTIVTEAQKIKDVEYLKKFFTESASGKRLGAGIPVDALAAATRVGAYYLEAGVRNFAQWSEALVKDLGESIRPHLRDIWSESNASHLDSLLTRRIELNDLIKETRKNLGATYKSLDKWGTVSRNIKSLTGLPKALWSSIDISAPGRQGMIGTVTHPIESAKAFGRQMQALIKSPEAYRAMEDDFRADPFTDYSRKSMGVDYTLAESSGVHDLNASEEVFASTIANKIPGIRQSEQAYVTFLNNQRRGLAKVYDKWLRRMGATPETHPNEFKGAGEIINTLTGRAAMKPGTANMLNHFLYSARWWKSRMQLVNPVFYGRLAVKSPRAASLLAADMVKFTGAVGATLWLVHQAGKSGIADVGTSLDPNDPDFLKIRWGNTHYDISGGMQQEVRFAFKLFGAIKDQQDGKIVKKGGIAVNKDTGKVVQTPLTIIEEFARRKLSPVAGEVVNALSGETLEIDPTTGKRKPYSIKPYPTGFGLTGQKEIVPEGPLHLLVPGQLILNNFEQAYNADGARGVVRALPEVVGISTQTYKKQPKQPKGKTGTGMSMGTIRMR